MMVLLVRWVPVCGEVRVLPLSRRVGRSMFGAGWDGAGENCELRNGSG
ncbi:hypothetical protein Rhow_005977 [Rhodococcus wratislaviensis]|uniref:Uncharacterized protein n=1 Tax=Rhodococcus wratislaviensis TaxID=44752 RepID=A0A402C062_RHOWR|nr:hypothetical protein Rhow_005977 [Rhodococcus wratislaviensis]